MKEIPGDKDLSIKNVVFYLFFNFIRGVLGYTSRLKTKYALITGLKKGHESPSRKHLNQFLRQVIPGLLRTEKMDILDIGCGSGYLVQLLSGLGYRGNYVGLDLVRHKDFNAGGSSDFKLSRVIGDITNFLSENKYDFIVSITALEHVVDDKLAVLKASLMAKPGGVLLFVVLSFWSLFLYLTHGYRYYNPRRLKHLFSQEDARIFRLGGFFSFLLHFLFITIPFFIFKTERSRKLKIYPKLAEICNILDRYIPYLFGTICDNFKEININGSLSS